MLRPFAKMDANYLFACSNYAGSWLFGEKAMNHVRIVHNAVDIERFGFQRLVRDALREELGVKDVITSPTFAIVNEYTDGQGEPVYHFDFYRIKKQEEVYDIGFEDYVESGSVCLMEWPELIEPLLPEDTLKVHIDEQPDGSRPVTF